MAIEELTREETVLVSGGKSTGLGIILDPILNIGFAVLSSKVISNSIQNFYNGALNFLQKSGLDNLIGKVVGRIL